MNDTKALDSFGVEADSIYVTDRGYIDFSGLYTLHRAGGFFVRRAKTNMNYHRISLSSIDKISELCSDQGIMLGGCCARQHYSGNVRGINFFDPEKKKTHIPNK